MRKKDMMAALARFDDDDEIMIGDKPTIGEVHRVCGKGQRGMVYKCVLAPGHDGECYCSRKGVSFVPDEDDEETEND